ncbi:cohesin domain-containing protein [Clostridium cellulovorans]|uniref:Cellulosome anchoring protein cohesin region n=1 Tax=Clostridium cellulovorans (strain ATCC 35296 / DSM 3052 / OCM 3 / 743B) TaxID=573061 RepID=D9SN67_CLOC7|nr:cohesin domain-containing protein [Clostridium cellulovorans]ADL51933.1 hypothetical protein Clocel_2192 [Clostridium cellulovorans 743B]
MKRIFNFAFILFVFLLVLRSTSVQASDASIEIKTLGEVKKGNFIDIQIDLNNITNMYAASVDFNYDSKIILVKNISVNRSITGENIYEYNYPNNENNKAKYGFTFLGDTKGYTGTNNFLSIKAEVLSDGKLNINSDNFKIELVEKVNTSLVDIDYQLIVTEQMKKVKEPNNDESRKTESSASNNIGSNKNIEQNNITENSSFIDKTEINTTKTPLQQETTKIEKNNNSSGLLNKVQNVDSSNDAVPKDNTINDILDFNDKEGINVATETLPKDEANNPIDIDEKSSNSFFLPVIIIAILLILGSIMFYKKVSRRNIKRI